MTSDSKPNLGETENYVLTTGPDYDSKYPERTAYHLLNKDTGVIEAIGPQLPSALLALHSLQEQLDEVSPDPIGELKRREQAMKANPFEALGLTNLTDEDDDGPTFN